MQSLSVIFLFRAFVEPLLVELYEGESPPVLALDEPETHLHPQDVEFGQVGEGGFSGVEEGWNVMG